MHTYIVHSTAKPFVTDYAAVSGLLGCTSWHIIEVRSKTGKEILKQVLLTLISLYDSDITNFCTITMLTNITNSTELCTNVSFISNQHALKLNSSVNI
jgi:hypothetical protein